MVRNWCVVCGKDIDETEQTDMMCFDCYNKSGEKQMNMRMKRTNRLEWILVILFNIFIFILIIGLVIKF